MSKSRCEVQNRPRQFEALTASDLSTLFLLSRFYRPLSLLSPFSNNPELVGSAFALFFPSEPQIFLNADDVELYIHEICLVNGLTVSNRFERDRDRFTMDAAHNRNSIKNKWEHLKDEARRLHFK